MLVRFWGTRGSLPVAMTAETVRRKIVNALLAADGRKFADRAEAEAFAGEELGFAASSTYGGASPCVEIEAGDRHQPGSFAACAYQAAR